MSYDSTGNSCVRRLLIFVTDDPRNLILPLSFVLGVLALAAVFSNRVSLFERPPEPLSYQ